MKHNELVSQALVSVSIIYYRSHSTVITLGNRLSNLIPNSVEHPPLNLPGMAIIFAWNSLLDENAVLSRVLFLKMY